MSKTEEKRTKSLQNKIKELENSIPTPLVWQGKWDKASEKDKIKVLAQMLGIKV